MQTARVFQGELKPVLSSQETFSSHSVHNRTSSGLMLLGLDSAEIGEYFALKHFAEYRKGERLMIQCHIPSLEFSHLIATSSFLSRSFSSSSYVQAAHVLDLCCGAIQSTGWCDGWCSLRSVHGHHAAALQSWFSRGVQAIHFNQAQGKCGAHLFYSLTEVFLRLPYILFTLHVLRLYHRRRRRMEALTFTLFSTKFALALKQRWWMNALLAK